MRERDRERKRETERDRERETQGERERERNRNRERAREKRESERLRDSEFQCGGEHLCRRPPHSFASGDKQGMPEARLGLATAARGTLGGYD